MKMPHLPEKTPHGLEYLIGGVLTTEDILVTSRAHQINDGELPRPATNSLDEFSVYNTGDLFNGYIFAFWADGLLSYSLPKLYDFVVKRLGKESCVSKCIAYFREDYTRVNVASGILSSLSISFFETTGILNTPDVKDIPAGVAGALLYVGARYANGKWYWSSLSSTKQEGL